jgi:hypothetical protein
MRKETFMMMKRIMHKMKLVLIGALIAGLDKIRKELEEYLEGEQGEVHEEPSAMEAGGNA